MGSNLAKQTIYNKIEQNFELIKQTSPYINPKIDEFEKQVDSLKEKSMIDQIINIYS